MRLRFREAGSHWLCVVGSREGGVMFERAVVVVPKAGLHARPAARFVQTAKGERGMIRVDGEDERQAVEALAETLSREEGE